LHPSEEGRGQDTYNVIATFVHKHIEGNWWEWIWACHDAAEQIVRDNWEHVHQLAVRMAAIPPYANAHQQAAGAPSGDASGQALVNWCQEIGVPIHHPDRVSAAYIP
jgi:hypothetical protein